MSLCRRTHTQLPTVTVEYRGLGVEADALVGEGGNPTVGNAFKELLRGVACQRGLATRPVQLLRDVNGALEPVRGYAGPYCPLADGGAVGGCGAAVRATGDSALTLLCVAAMRCWNCSKAAASKFVGPVPPPALEAGPPDAAVGPAGRGQDAAAKRPQREAQAQQAPAGEHSVLEPLGRRRMPGLCFTCALQRDWRGLAKALLPRPMRVQVSGTVKYNGVEPKDFFIRRTTGLVDQREWRLRG